MRTGADLERSGTATAAHVARHAREIAEAGDEWFLSVASGLGRLGSWARHEASIAADSAVAAFATTVNVAKKLAGVAAPSARDDAPVPDDDEDQSAESDGDAASSANGTGHGIGLVSAVRPRPSATPSSEPSHDEAVDALPSESLARGSAGVVPLLQALGHTVAEYTHRGYASLQQDDRFWTLIHLLQVLGRPNIGDPQNETTPPAEKEPEEIP